jgi:hypothetical protein
MKKSDESAISMLKRLKNRYKSVVTIFLNSLKRQESNLYN